VILPIIGAFLGWLAMQRGSPQTPSVTAIVVNAAALVVWVVAIFAFGGS
jgi:hypothetical protein